MKSLCVCINVMNEEFWAFLLSYNSMSLKIVLENYNHYVTYLSQRHLLSERLGSVSKNQAKFNETR